MSQAQHVLADRSIVFRDIRGIGRRAYMRAECVLDKLRDNGSFGRDQHGERRFNAAEWLKFCFHRAGLDPAVSMTYDVMGRDRGEMSQAQAWNRKCFNDTLREMGSSAAILTAVCCHDEHPGKRLQDLLDGLDKLARHRGM